MSGGWTLQSPQLPAPRVPDPRSAPSLRWGIAGPGWIAERFAESLHRHGSQRVTAVGSRSLDRARQFAEPRGLRAHGSYGELAADPEVDVVYVATPHTAHHEVALAALEAGKHVLIEKPIAVNEWQAREIADAAASRGLFAAEALWTFFLPKYDVVRQLIADGHLGQLRGVIADYGEYFGPEHRIFDPALAGGPLLDLGTYLLAIATDLLGEPDRIHAVGTGHPSGVNAQLTAALGFPDGAQASLSTNIYGFTPATATIVGTDAVLTLDGPFNAPGGFTVRTADGATLRYNEPAGGHVDGLHFQAAAVARAIDAGSREVAERPLADSVLTMRVADALRGQLGISFPGD